ncbi:MAG: endonuclease/exonuclease/phosphatase family protein [Chitinophagaceae bacterium]
MRPILSFILLLFSMATSAQTIKIATYNLRYANTTDIGNLWIERKHAVVDLIQYHQFDIFGVQEAVKLQLEDLKIALPSFDYYGVGRDDGQSAGEHSSIFYKKERFTLLDKGDFWLSQTPEKPGFGWDAKFNRICSWVKLSDKRTKKIFFVFNAHYDHQGMVAREESSKLVLSKIQLIAGESPVVFMGDLNGGRDTNWYLLLANSSSLKDTYDLVEKPYQLNGSFNGFNANEVRKDVIDHIFVSKHFKADRWAVLTDTYFGKFPSDHFPVAVEINF